MTRPTYALLASSFLLLNITLSLAVFAPVGTSAHDDPSPHSDTQMSDKKTETNTTNYEFVTPEGCSLSLLTRRALQLYDQQKNIVTLTPAAAMYAETNIVQRMGSRGLEIGEKVSIELPLLDEYVMKSSALNPDTLAAWQVYANQADFSVSYITPSSAVTPVATNPTDINALANQNDATKPQTNNPDFKNAPRLSVFGWIAGLFALAGLYYLLDQRNQQKKKVKS